MKVRRAGCLIGLAVAGGLLVALVLGRGRLLPAVAAWLDVGEPPQRADAVLLLLGDSDTRPMAAAALVKAGWARRVLLNTTPPTRPVETGVTLPDEEINRRMLLRCGVPAEDIVLLDGRVQTTRDEALALADYLASSPATHVLVVTEWPHTRRARWILRQVLGDRAKQTTIVSVPTDDYQIDAWWRSEEGFAFVSSEYLKLGFYAVRYGAAGYVAAIAAALVLAWWAYRRSRAAPGTQKELHYTPI